LLKREPILVFLGAGASIDAGIPSTAALTKEVASLQVIASEVKDVVLRNGYYGPALSVEPNKIEFIAKMIARGLQTTIETPNFEHILATMEDLLTLANAHRGRGVEDEDINLLSPFVWLDSRYEVLSNPSVIGYTRWQAITRIIDKTRSAIVDNQQVKSDTKHFFDELKKTYSVKSFTLNYDTVVDDIAADCFDGFTERTNVAGQLFCNSFDARNFESEFRQSDKHTLIHMHGSVKFSYRAGSTVLVKYDAPDVAFLSLKYAPADLTDQGKIISATPVISGFNKVAKLNHSPIPYGYYYRAFVDTILDANLHNLIIIGYGGGDQYVNTWFREFVRLSGDKRRVVYVCACGRNGRKSETEREQSHIKCKKFMENFIDEKTLEGIDHFKENFTRVGDQLVNINSGFPMNPDIIGKISTFLIE